jgi:opacity protein-like surface antigen
MEIAVRGFFRPLAAAALLLIALATASAADRVQEFRGTGNTTTAIFRVESPWLLDWRLDGDFDELVALDITLVEANSGRHIGRVLHTKRKGNGVKLFNSGGRYQLRISSSLARWTIKIDQLTPEEAELYVPK